MNNTIALEHPNEDCSDSSERQFPIERIIEFYEEASVDFGHWSAGLNMHFGYYRRGFNPFNREKMVEQTNLEVADRLRLKTEDAAFLIDLGCGAGATARSIAKNYPNSIIKGVTLARWQVEKAGELNLREKLQKRIEIFKGDYTALPFENGAADGVWAIESACYAAGAAKENLIGEMARVLKKGGRFVVADCFVKRPERKFNKLTEKCYAAVCQNWGLVEMPSLEDFLSALEKYGFRDVTIEDISWRIAPSVAQAPFAVTTFFFKKMLAGEPLKQESVKNLKASLLALILGLNRSKFSYCLISGTRG